MSRVPDRKKIAKVNPPMPVDAFVLLVTGLAAMLPDDIPDDKLLMANEPGNAFSAVVADDVEVPRCFTTGHFEIRWVDDER